MRKKNRAGRIRLPDYSPRYKATVIKTAQAWHKNRNTDHWNRIGSSEINLCTSGPLIYGKVVLGKLDSYMQNKNEIITFLNTIQKHKLKMDQRQI